MQPKTNMDQHKFIIASDRDMLGTWTEPSIIDVQSLPEHGGGARGIVVQGVGVKTKTTKRSGGPTTTVLTEQYSTEEEEVAAAADDHDVHVVEEIHEDALVHVDSHNPMINTLRPAKTKLGKERIRMKWTVDVNEYILRTYYTITNMETNCKHYRDTLHRLFNEAFPDVEVCAQRIADQRRAIVKNNLLPQERIDQIRQEVEQMLQSGELATTTTGSVVTMGGAPSSSSVSKISDVQTTTWYAYVKEDDDDPEVEEVYNPGPSSHKLRKVGPGKGATTTAHNAVVSASQHQPQHNIIIHTTSLGTSGAHTSIGQLRR